MLEMYQELFRIEQIATEKKATPLRRRRIRQLHSKPLLATMKEWMEKKKRIGVLPKSSLGVAIDYALARWGTLEEFLKDGNLPLSNNISERAMRGVVMGRNNYRFSDRRTRPSVGRCSIPFSIRASAWASTPRNIFTTSLQEWIRIPRNASSNSLRRDGFPTV